MPWLNETNRKWRERAREVAEKVVRPLAKKYDVEQAYPWEVKDALAKAGLLGVWIPKEYGGSGDGLLNLCICVEELSRACGGVGVMYAVNALGSFPILLAGTEAQKKKYLPLIASGKKLISFGLSEKFAGSDAQGLRCQASPSGDSYVLDGEKKPTNSSTLRGGSQNTVCTTKSPAGLALISFSPPNLQTHDSNRLAQQVDAVGRHEAHQHLIQPVKPSMEPQIKVASEHGIS